MRDITGYETSRDYATLARLAETQSVVCIVDYQHGCRDVAQTLNCESRYGVNLRISARGITYVDAITVEEFERQCRFANVEFLVPCEISSAHQALREISQTSPSVESGQTFREWAKEKARAVVQP